MHAVMPRAVAKTYPHGFTRVSQVYISGILRELVLGDKCENSG